MASGGETLGVTVQAPCLFGNVPSPDHFLDQDLYETELK